MKRTLFRSTFGRWKAFALIGICLVGLACAIYVLAGGACSIGYRASSSTNRWEARYLLHSGEMTRALKPHPGEDALEVRAQNLGGRLTVVLSDETGREVYRRDIDGEISTQIPCVSPITARVETRRNRGAFSFQWIRASENPHPDTGKIYLYGELHGAPDLLAKEVALWEKAYANGMRHLFVEYPYYTAEWLNLWMETGEDAILEQVYTEWEGTQGHVPEILEYFRAIRKRCPETVFDGIDVGHQYQTTGERFLRHLEEKGQQESEAYRRTLACIEQGKTFARTRDFSYREEKMTENFLRAFSEIGEVSAFAINGWDHIQPDVFHNSGQTVVTIANRLEKRFPGRVLAVGLVEKTDRGFLYGRGDVEIGGEVYPGEYYGQQSIDALSDIYRKRAFWRIAGAYAAHKDDPKTGDVLPYDNYPLLVEKGDVFCIIYTKKDGSTECKYYRADGNRWEGKPTTEEFLPGDASAVPKPR